ncbi:hypothetical protein TNCT_190991 [Trichonephila clavata]|uniref:Uncharacterized protein n=1 Tax=Trichonephila clavata TaxID=2740835 RepID=A0A8X6J2C1_TRICU|nr:hypothetical protein TNCT_190991 [Trichonephila clavata]
MKCWYLIFVFIFQLTFDICSPEDQNRFSIPYTNDALIFYGVNKGYTSKYKVDPQILKHRRYKENFECFPCVIYACVYT